MDALSLSPCWRTRREWLRLCRRILHIADPRCCYCRRLVKFRRSTVDHAVPRSRGGTDDLSNLRLACQRCNEVKADRTVAQWLDDLRAAVEGGAA